MESGKVIDKCRVEDVPDRMIMRELKVPRTIRVELTLKEAGKLYESKGPDVVEVFSPPRIVQEAGLRECGGIKLKEGWSIDLTMNDPIDGQPWDLNDPVQIERLIHLVKTYKPFIVIGSPPCTAFSGLRNLSKGRRDPKKGTGRSRSSHPAPEGVHGRLQNTG